MNNSCKTNWKRIDAMTDDEIDISDSPLLTDDFFAKAKWLMPGESAARQKGLPTEYDRFKGGKRRRKPSAISSKQAAWRQPPRKA